MPLVTAAHAPAAVCYRVTRTIPVGGQPGAVAVDPAARTVYVANAGDGTVSVLDAATGTVTRTIPVGYSPWRWRWIPLPAPSTWPTPAVARCR